MITITCKKCGHKSKLTDIAESDVRSPILCSGCGRILMEGRKNE